MLIAVIAPVGLLLLVGLIFSLTYWQGQSFGHLNYEHALRLMVPSVTEFVNDAVPATLRTPV